MKISIRDDDVIYIRIVRQSLGGGVTVNGSEGASPPEGAALTTAGRVPAAPDAVPVSRAERRKARTRQMLIDAARGMLAAGTATQASIQEITDAADLGFGSFYNHFSTKTELFEAAVADVLEELGELFDRLSVDVQDAATAFAQSVRLTLRLCRSRPQISAVLVREGMHYMESEGGVAPRLLRDI